MRLRDLQSRWQFLPGRRLLFEELERRDLLAVMRVVDWNTFNGPNDAADDADFRTVFEAIGNETVQGNTQRIDILAVQETDPPGAGDSIGRIQNVLNSLYATTSYSLVVTPVDGGGDSTGFVYDTSTVSLLESVQVGAGSLTHNIMRAKFQPIGTLASSIFYVYSVHLKSGTTNADATLRGSEAAALRADADALGEGTQVLMVGDFNMNTSAEAAWTNVVAAGAGQLQDVANAPGNWADNAAFKNLHSQDPGGAMDDRFDIHFASGEFFDGGGVDYVANSFHVFGNNGTHTLNSTIDTGTGATPTVLAALIAASDHLPVVADYQILSFTPSVIVSQTLASTKVVEGGLYDTYQLVLNTVPSANVVVTVTPDAQVDVGNGAGVARQFTFTPANAQTPQTVVVHAADDAIGEGNHTGLISHSSTSADATYNGLTISGLTVAIVDNEAPAFVINEVDVDQAGTDTQEFVEIYDGGVGNVSLNGMTLVLFNGATDTAYTVVTFGPSDFTDSRGFFVVGDSAVSPTPNKLFSTASNSIQQGQDAVALYSGAFSVGGAVTTTNLIDALVYDTGQADDAGLLVLLQPGQQQINEDQGSLGTTNSMSRVPDGISAAGGQRETNSYAMQAPTPSAYNQALPFGVLVLQSAQRVEVVEGGLTDSYQIALLSIPTANVQVTIDPDSQTDLGAGAGVAIVLTFTPGNALIPQTVNVAAVDDVAIEGAHTSIITHALASADSRYNGFSVPNVVASITDNDPTAAPAGDYNHNSVVDAGDYVLWRKTLGSTTALAADGSGPTPGVPNGVVDAADYTYWRSLFGNTSPGSGAGSGQAVVVAASGSSQEAVEKSGETAALSDSAAGNTTLFGLPLGGGEMVAGRRVLQSSLVGSAPVNGDLLLAALRFGAAADSIEDEFVGAGESSDDSAAAAVDELFSTLDVNQLLAVI